MRLMTGYKTIPFGDNNYAINRDGKVINRKYNREKKSCINCSGYMCISLVHKAKQRHFLLHRLLAEVFIPNPDNKPHINHIDHNKLNNSLDNLEWCTPSENHEAFVRMNEGIYEDLSDYLAEVKKVLPAYLKGEELSDCLNIYKSNFFKDWKALKGER